jgi:uncharacterized protein with gpF-like domain
LRGERASGEVVGVWKRKEHASAFTAAKVMRLDALSDLHTAVVDAMEKRQSFESFKKNINPVLQQKGRRGKKEITPSPAMTTSDSNKEQVTGNR